MRTNLPVTQSEHQFPEGETLLSTTDTSGNITYANAAFIRISGFAVEELIGQPHNIVRHPDMPTEAFADMWRSLKEGQSWTALVKNRRKNGDPYWVRANVAPMRRNGVLVGYLSVRTKPTHAEIVACELLCRKFKDGKAQGIAFYQGLVIRTGLPMDKCISVVAIYLADSSAVVDGGCHGWNYLVQRKHRRGCRDQHRRSDCRRLDARR